MDPVAEFAATVASGEPPLDRATALIAAAGRTDVEPQVLLDRLDLLAAETTGATATELCRSLFTTHGFAGNRGDYYDPRNSLLDQVLDRRLGIPITLAVLGMEVGRRRGVELVGVGMPGHFLIGERRDRGSFFDAFDGGRPLDREDCRAAFELLHGAQASWDESFLDPTSPLKIVSRMLNNLRSAYLRLGDRAGLLQTLRLQVVLPGAGVGERRQLAGVLAAEGRFVEAAERYDELSESDGPRSEDHRRTATRLRANLN